MIEALKDKIEKKRLSGKFFWIASAFLKDFLWFAGEKSLIFKLIQDAKAKRIKNQLFAGAVFFGAKTKPLLGLSLFEPVFKDFKGKKIGFVSMAGNVGDWLIEKSAIQLLEHFGVDFEAINSREKPLAFFEDRAKSVDEFAVCGGGSMGDFKKGRFFQKPVFEIRKKLLRYKKPIIILPQTFCGREDCGYSKIFARDKESIKFCEAAILAPDLALGYVYEGRLATAKYDAGIWMRKDIEKTPDDRKFFSYDPAFLCNAPEEYIQLASLYKKVVTNRLHFAIASLIAGRETVLLPNSYFKNRAVYETWLKDLGCQWMDRLP